MDLDLINISALARMIMKDQNFEESALEATISAIRRYKLDYHDPIFDKAAQIIKLAPTLSTKGRLVGICVFSENDLKEVFNELCALLDCRSKNIFRIAQLEKCITIIIEERDLEKLKTFFQRFKGYKIHSNIAELKLDTDSVVHKTPGLIALLSTELAINSINIIDIISSGTEIVVYVNEKDLVKAHDAIHKLCENQS
jgi:aspartokinase